MTRGIRKHGASLSRAKRFEFPCKIICTIGRTVLFWLEQVPSGQGQRQIGEIVNLQPKPHSSHNHKRQELLLWPQPSQGEMLFTYHQPSLQVLKNGTHNKHCDQKILLGDLSVREDVVQYSVHVTLVLLPKGEHAFVIVTCKQQKEVILTHVWMFTFTCYLFVF